MQVICGALTVNGQALKAGDAAQTVDETELDFADAQDTEFLLFDLPR